jgi:hypothetical protein
MGKESSGAQLAFVAAQYKFNPSVFGVKLSKGQKSEQRVSALGKKWYNDDRLYVIGGADGNYGDGYAFGVDAPQKNFE